MHLSPFGIESGPTGRSDTALDPPGRRQDRAAARTTAHRAVFPPVPGIRSGFRGRPSPTRDQAPYDE